jgi:hypothetical protein
VDGARAHGGRPEDPGHLHPVTRFCHVDQLVEEAEGHGVGRFPLGDRVGGLLEAHRLLVAKVAAVVDQSHGLLGGALGAGADCGLLDAACKGKRLRSGLRCCSAVG